MALPRTIPLPRSIRTEEARRRVRHNFHFGGDPEFSIYKSSGGGRASLSGSSRDIPVHDESTIIFGGEGLNRRKGWIKHDYRTCFEINTNFSARWLEDFWGVCKALLQNEARTMGRNNQRGYIRAITVPPRGSVNGGHLHITAEDPEWFYSFQALVTLPFWIQFVATITDKQQLDRINSGQGYGKWGEIDASPPREMGTTSTIQLGTGPNRTGPQMPHWINRWADEPRQSGTRGYEYRGIQQWVGDGPSNNRFREVLFGAIYNILFASSRQVAAQEMFMKKLIEAVGGNPEGAFFSNGMSIPDAMSRIRNTGSWSRSSQPVFDNIVRGDGSGERIKRFLRNIKDVHNDTEMPNLDWLIDALDPTDTNSIWIIDDLNRDYKYEFDAQLVVERPDLMTVSSGQARARPQQMLPTWTPESLWNALDVSYEIMQEQTESTWWYYRGAQLVKEMRLQFPGANGFTSGGHSGICRDAGLFQIMALGTSVANYAINKIIPNGKWIRNISDPIQFVGCGDHHGTPTTMFFYNDTIRPGEQPAFHRIGNNIFSDECQRDGFQLATLGSISQNFGHFWIKRSIRDDADYDLPIMLVAAYLLYRLGYMDENGIRWEIPEGYYEQVLAEVA